MSLSSSFLPTGLGYVYTLSDEYAPDLLTIEVNNLRNRSGSPYALLTASTTISGARRLPGSNRVLNAEVWILSENSRESYARALDRLIPAPDGAAKIDFGAVLAEVSQRVIEHENRPVDVVTLQKPKAKQVQWSWLIDGMLPAKRPTILYGAGGVGKSIFAATIATAVQSGKNLLGLGVHPTPVLYLDWETDEDDIAARVQAAAEGLKMEMPPVRYASLVRPIEDRIAQLARYVAENEVGLVIIDSAGMAMSSARDGADASDGAIRFFRALRSLGAAVLVIDHIAGEDMRRGRTGASKPYGSVYKWNSARNAFELRERKPEDQKGTHLVLKHRKTNIGARMRDLNLLLNWDDGGATFSTERVTAGPVQALDQRVLDVLASGPATPHQIADMLSDDDVTVHEMDIRNVVKGLLGTRLTVLADGNVRLRIADAEQGVVQTALEDE